VNGLFFYVAVTEIEREMRHATRGAGPDGGYDPDDVRHHHARLRRLSSREGTVTAETASESALHDLQPGLASSSC
jgi:hypothetical protein